MTLPSLLEETARPDKKRLKAFYDYIHRWRCFLFQEWRSSTTNNISDERIGHSADRLIGLVFLLEHCKRYDYFDIEVSRFSDVWHDGTFGDLRRKITGMIPCPILGKVFEAVDSDDVPLPSSFLDNGFERRIRHSLWVLLLNHPVPLWLFGDYHQLCVANPHGMCGERKRSSQVRYARGIHYTPAPIVDYLTATILNDDPSSEFPGVLDPSCGCGSFLIAAFRYLVAKKAGDHLFSRREKTVLEILGRSLFGVDVDSQAIDWTIRLLYLESKRLMGRGEGDVDPYSVPDLSDNFLVRSFFDVNRQTFGGRVKTILGGPPFVRYTELKKNQPELVEQLRERFSSIKTGQFDLYMPFIEHAIDLLDDGNRIGFSLSNSFLHTGTGKGICRFITDRCTPREVLEFSGGSIYPDAAVQIALLRLIVGKNGQDRGRHVFFEPTTDVRVPLENIFTSDALSPDMGKIVSLRDEELIPKTLSTALCIRSNITDGVRFGDLPIEFFYGATSKSDEIFMLKDRGTGSNGVRHGLPRNAKRTVHFERELTVPIIRGREIKGFRYSPVKYFYLAPYIEGKLIDRQTLENAYPMAFRYLDRFQNDKNEDWYAYYAPPVYRQGDVIISCRIASPRSFARMDLSDKTIHGSAFGIVVNGDEMDISMLMLYLNSSDFWKQLDATMPPMGVGRRAIRMSILKELMVSKRIAFPTEQDVADAKALEKRIAQVVGRRKLESIKSIFVELDSYIEGIVS